MEGCAAAEESPGLEDWINHLDAEVLKELPREVLVDLAAVMDLPTEGLNKTELRAALARASAARRGEHEAATAPAGVEMEEEAAPKVKERKPWETKVPRKMKVLPPTGSTRKGDVLEYVRRHRVPTTNEPERMSLAELRSEAYQYDDVL